MKKVMKHVPLLSLVGFILLLTYIFGFMSGTNFGKKTVTPQVCSAAKEVSEDKLLKVVNDWRTSKGKKNYKIDTILCGYATERVKEVKSDWSHKQFKTMNKIDSFITLGENLSKDIFNEAEILNSWLNSPTHRENLENSFTHSCIRCEDNYCVQLFGKY